MAEETWRILITEDSSGSSAAAAGAPPPAGGTSADATTAEVQTKEKVYYQQADEFFKGWKPFLIAGGLLYGMYQNSQIVSSVVSTVGKIIGAIMDLILLPLMPIFVAIVQAIVPMLPRIQALAERFFTPIVNWLLPKIESFVNWLETEINWDSIGNWLDRVSNTIVSWISTIWDWISGIDWGGIFETVVNGVQGVWRWINSIDWGYVLDLVIYWLKEVWYKIEYYGKWIGGALAAYVADQLGGRAWDALLGWIPVIGDSLASLATVITDIGAGAWAYSKIPSAGVEPTYPEGSIYKNQGGGAAGAGVPEYQHGGHIYETGLAFLHAGERVLAESEAGSGFSGEMYNTFNIEIATNGTVDDLAREIEGKITDRLSSIMRRQ